MPTKIHGAEYPIEKIFCGDFVFSIPMYQRPYAWEVEQAETLLDDLLSFLGDGVEPIDEVNPYFLGTIVRTVFWVASRQESHPSIRVRIEM